MSNPIILLCLISILISTLAMDFSNGTHNFANNVYNILKRKNGNIFFSPISAHAVLSMAYLGATGDTARNLQNTLNLPEPNVTSRKYRGIITSLDATEDVELYMANNIYIQKGYTLKPSFLFEVTNFFMADVQNIDFSKQIHAAQQISTWVKSKTNNKIKDIITENDISEDTRLILVNALYFKGLWLHSFSKQDTRSEKFYVSNTAAIDCQMMHIKEKYFHAESHELDAKILKMPYVNERTNLIIILPKSTNGIKYLEKKLVHMDVFTLLGTMNEIEVVVSLPKFKIELAMDLSDTLSEMGLADIFGNKAEFNNMIDSPELISVSKVVQKAFIEVNEEGSEAAAATGVIARRKRSVDVIEHEFKADKPFMFYLIHNSTIIFLGKLTNPNTNVVHDEL